MISPDELFETITGCDFKDKIALMALQESFKMKPHLVDKPGIESNYNFETAWEKCKIEAETSTTDANNASVLVDPLTT